MKLWYSAEELSGVAGLPVSPQAINKKGTKEQWCRRKREGVQGGKAVEYYMISLPKITQAELSLKESIRLYCAHNSDSLALWVMIYQSMTVEQRELMTTQIMTKGIRQALKCLLEHEERKQSPES